MSTASMTTARWREYSIAVWIILAVITGLILWFGWPAIRAVVAIIQFYWVIFTTGPHSGEWFQRACECVSTLSKRLIVNSFRARKPVIQLLSTVNRLTTYEPLDQVSSTHLSAATAIALVKCLLLLILLSDSELILQAKMTVCAGRINGLC